MEHKVQMNHPMRSKQFINSKVNITGCKQPIQMEKSKLNKHLLLKMSTYSNFPWNR